eukprot:14434_1
MKLKQLQKRVLSVVMKFMIKMKLFCLLLFTITSIISFYHYNAIQSLHWMLPIQLQLHTKNEHKRSSIAKGDNDTCSNVMNTKIHLFDTQSDECAQTFNYCDQNTPFLLSYGGSGNTVTRLIISYITDIYSGSIYRDDLLRHILKGESRCGDQGGNEIVVIKAHPEHFQPNKLIAFFEGNCSLTDCVCNGHKHTMSPALVQTTNDDYTVPSFNAIFILRDPWKSIWSLYQYGFGSGCAKHNDQSVHMQHIYTTSTAECPIASDKLWNATRFGLHLWKGRWSFRHWLHTFSIMHIMKQYNKTYIKIKFENLVHKKASIAIREMNKITEYLYLDEYYKAHKMRLMRKMECLVTVYMKRDLKRFKAVHRRKARLSRNQVTMDHAYHSVGVKTICSIWNHIGRFATHYGYQIWNNTDCTDIDA